jgi:hypothetical protein
VLINPTTTRFGAHNIGQETLGGLLQAVGLLSVPARSQGAKESRIDGGQLEGELHELWNYITSKSQLSLGEVVEEINSWSWMYNRRAMVLTSALSAKALHRSLRVPVQICSLSRLTTRCS